MEIDLGYNTRSSSKAKIVLNIDGVIQSHTLAVCNHVNNFFTTVATDLTDKLPEVSNDFGVRSDSFERFYSSKGVSNNGFELRFVDKEFIHDELHSLNIHKAVDLDDTAPRIL